MANDGSSSSKGNEVQASVLMLQGRTLRLNRNIVTLESIAKISVRGPNHTLLVILLALFGIVSIVFIVGILFLILAFYYWRRMKTKNFLVLELASGTPVLIGPYSVKVAWRAGTDVADYIDAYQAGTTSNNYIYDITTGSFTIDKSATVNNFGDIESLNQTQNA